MDKNTTNITNGMVFDIQRYSIEDGPGIRTTVFLKGCPLRCKWCSNPESQLLEMELAYFRVNCQLCGDCAEACPIHAIMSSDNSIEIDRNKCTKCMVCVEACENSGLQVVGSEMSVDEVMQIVSRDLPFYKSSGGGVTLSGGEPAFQAYFSTNILYRSKQEGINTAIETSGYAEWVDLEMMMEFTDIILYDLKIMNSENSIKHTGVSNEMILENLSKINDLSKELYVRIPIIPGYTDSEDNIKMIIKYTKKMKSIVRYDLLPFHQLGRHKYRALDIPYQLDILKTMKRSDMHPIIKIFNDSGLKFKAFGA